MGVYCTSVQTILTPGWYSVVWRMTVRMAISATGTTSSPSPLAFAYPPLFSIPAPSKQTAMQCRDILTAVEDGVVLLHISGKSNLLDILSQLQLHPCRQWRDFSCSTNLQCRVWMTGQFCCPDSRCCHSLPDYNAYYADYSTVRYEDTYAYTWEGEYQAVTSDGEVTDIVDTEDVHDKIATQDGIEEETNIKRKEPKVR